MGSKLLLKAGLIGSGCSVSCSIKFRISARVESTRPLGNLFQYLTAVAVHGKDIDILEPVLHLRSAEYRERITGPDALSSLLLRKPNTRLAFLAARRHCWLRYSCCPPGSQSSFWQSCLPVSTVAWDYSTPDAWCLSLPNFRRFLSAISSAHQGPSE